MLPVCLTLCVFIGCGKQAAVSGAGSTNSVDATMPGLEPDTEPLAREALDDETLPAGLTNSTPPDQIVTAFLEALRSGDASVAEALLSRRAREETRKRDLTVQQLGSPEATFTVGPTKYLDAQQNGAHVNTTWTEGNQGATINYDIVWALRRQDAGWRVAGMGAQLGPGQPVVYLNFEDPDDMLAKWREADEAVAAAEAVDQGIRQAQVPQSQNPPASATLQR